MAKQIVITIREAEGDVQFNWGSCTAVERLGMLRLAMIDLEVRHALFYERLRVEQSAIQANAESASEEAPE